MLIIVPESFEHSHAVYGAVVRLDGFDQGVLTPFLFSDDPFRPVPYADGAVALLFGKGVETPCE